MTEQQKAAILQALEILKDHYWFEGADDAIPALQRLIDQQAAVSHPKAENVAHPRNDAGSLSQHPAVTTQVKSDYRDWDYQDLQEQQPAAAPVQGLPFGVGGGLVAIKTLLSRDPCVHASVAIEMIDAILNTTPPAAPAQFDVTIEDDAAKMLRDMLGDDRDDLSPVRLLVGNGHSGYGLYAAQAEYQEEGAMLLAATRLQPFRVVKIVHECTPALGQEPLFWYRPCSNGMYEGPIHNAQIEEVRKQSGAWVPLVPVTTPPAAQPAAQDEDWNDDLTKALFERDQYHEMADDLAASIAEMTGVDIGEHSSANFPWRNALDAAENWIASTKPDEPAIPARSKWPEPPRRRLSDPSFDVAYEKGWEECICTIKLLLAAEQEQKGGAACLRQQNDVIDATDIALKGVV